MELMKALVLGCGNIGSVAAEDIAKSLSSIHVVIADKDEVRARRVAEKIGRDNVSWAEIDAGNRSELVNFLQDFDLVMGFLPGKLGYGLMEACIASGKDLVDVSFMEENPLTLHEKAVKAGVTIIPDCGLAPGISNLLVGHAAKRLDKVEKIHIMVGGLPEKPLPPLGYVITWSPESLIDEYTRKARIVKNGRIVMVDALDGLEHVDFPGVGRLEAFYTDGLRTLIDTFKSVNVNEMWEKTLRYPGHAEKVKMLRTLGFFDEKQIVVDGVNVSPRKVTAKLFEQKLRMPTVKDLVALKVEVSGVKNGKKARYAYHLLDFYDEKSGVTAMARTTAYPTSITAQLMLKGMLKVKGVIPPEKMGMNDKFFSLFLNELKKRGISIEEKEV
ncbi:MAG: saccharopine dehydrogenase [Thermoproteota archaeon]|nr:MAG: saccharopine dehydrogenase [Candidatus Korarchaeota archaeon]